MTPEDFDALFDSFRHTAFRWEGLPAYDVGGEEAVRIEAMRTGAPVPERSVRTDPWLARIAVTTVTAGKQWMRVRVVDDPMTEYQRIELNAYLEAQAAGDQTALVRRGEVPDGPDFWLFDGGTPRARAVVMSYDPDGRWTGAELVTDPARLVELDRRRRDALAVAEPLNVFVSHAAVVGG